MKSIRQLTLALCALAATMLPLVPLHAQDQGPPPGQQQKRIALVIGNGAYAKAPLATAANDGGLIAQTLQAAGFDVVGARDLDGDTLRRTFRDFVQKAQSSGPDTVAFVYLSGYGVQLAGENYFIPVDSTISRDTDIPVEGLRVSDYIRQLSTLPLKVSVFVLDAGRAQPFIEGGQPIAGGLALAEPDPHVLIAYNAAPGTVAPNETGSYGAYAQALAQMMRTGGLPLPELFDRVRLRVNELTKGAQIPWDTRTVDAQFSFFDRAPDAPAPPPDQIAAVRNKPMRDVGAANAYAMALEQDSLQGYGDFLAAYPQDPMAKRVRVIIAARREAIIWRATYRADTPDAYWSYMRRYPRGPHAADARRRLTILTAALEPPPAFTVMDYDVPPPPPEEIVYVDRPVLAFNDPYFDFAPPPPPPVYFLPPPPPDFVVLAPPPPPIGLFILPQPVFVPIPVYYSPPRYVAPPPNNIIFANIHNTTVINTVINRPAVPVAPGAAPPPAGGPPLGKGFAGPALPAAAAQRASLIQQGKAPMPASASINPGAPRPGTPGTGIPPAPGPAKGAPQSAVAPAGQPLPNGKALPAVPNAPAPGAKGVATAPNAAPAMAPKTAVAPAVSPPGKGAPAAPGSANGAPQSAMAPAGQALPNGKALPAAPNAPGVAPAPGAKGVATAPAAAPSMAPKTAVAPAASPPGKGAPTAASATPGSPTATQQQGVRPNVAARTPPGASGPPVSAAPKTPGPTPPVARVGRPAPAPTAALRPPAAPQIRQAPVRPSPPRPGPSVGLATPARPAMAAPPQPRPQAPPRPAMAAPPRPAPPPMAAPRPMPAMVARPAPPRPAGPKKCPPNAPRC